MRYFVDSAIKKLAREYGKRMSADFKLDLDVRFENMFRRMMESSHKKTLRADQFMDVFKFE